MEVEDMEAFFGEFVEGSEVDLDYEFDAFQFHDFIRGETNSEAREAERWFETAANHPPSPLVMKYLNKSISSSSKDAKKVKSTSKKQDVTAGSVFSQSTKNHKGREENVKVKTKSVLKPFKERSSTLMKPTASHLAKLIRESHAHPHLCRRSHNSSTHMSERKLQNSHAFDNAATKRQKLEIGYLWKIAQLKHENLLLHKINMKVRTGSGNLENFKAKVTIPKGPELVTQQRALNRRNNSETSEHAETRTGPFKARPLNKQMLQAPAVLPSKKGTRKLPGFKVFHLRTMERAVQHSSPNDVNMQNSASHCGAADFKRSKCEIPLKTRPRPLNNSKIFPTQEDIAEIKDVNPAKLSMESKILINKERLSQNPPTELFDKLSLISELEETVSRPKGHLPIKFSKENSPDYFQLEFWKSVGKPNQCGSGRGIPGIAIQPNMNRSMGIR